MTALVSHPASRADEHAPPKVEASDDYAVVRQGLDFLGQGRNDYRVVRSIVEAYSRLGLNGPARELLKEHLDLAECNEEGRGLAQRLAIKPSGRVAWGGVQARFEHGLQRLLTRHAHLQRMEDALRSLPNSCEIYRSTDGAMHLAERSASGKLRWVHGLANVDALAASLRLGHDPDDQFCANYLLCGDRFGAVLRRVHAGTAKMFMTFTPRIFVLAPEPRDLATALCVPTCFDALTDERTHVFAGETAGLEMAEFLRLHTEVGIPGFMLCSPPYNNAFEKDLTQLLGSLEEERAKCVVSLCEANRATYARCSATHWAKRFSERASQPLRALGITSRFTTVLQYSMRDVKAAFEQLGHSFEILLESSDHDLLTPEAFAKIVARVQPDLVFVIDHHRAEYPGLLPENVPFACWIQDMLPNLVSKSAGQSIGPMDFYLAATVSGLAASYDYPPSQGHVVTTVTNESLYSAERMTEAELAPHRCDFSFVSNQSTTPEDFHNSFLKTIAINPHLHKLCDRLFAILQADLMQATELAYPRRSTDVISEASEATGLALKSPELADALALQYVQPLGELMFRQSALHWVADYCEQRGKTLRLYGQGWEHHPRLARFACGIAANGATLRAIYQASAINLQINGYGAIHQRLLDGLASGGFFLIRQAGLDLIAEQLGLLSVEANPIEWAPSVKYRLCDRPDMAAAFEAERILAGCQQSIDQVEIDQPRWELYREIVASDLCRVAGAVFPQYADVSFGSREAFFDLAERYLSDAGAREAASSGMREIVLSRFTYSALVDRLLSFIEARMCETAKEVRGEA